MGGGTTATQVGAGDHHADDAGEGGGDAADQRLGSLGPRQRRPAVPARRCAQHPDAVADRAMLDLRKAKWSRVDGQARGPGPHKVRRRFAGGGRSMARDRGTDRTRHRPAAVMQVSAAHRPSSTWLASSWSSWAQSRLVGATGTRTSLPDAVTESLARRCEDKRADDFVMTTPA